MRCVCDKKNHTGRSDLRTKATSRDSKVARIYNRVRRPGALPTAVTTRETTVPVPPRQRHSAVHNDEDGLQRELITSGNRLSRTEEQHQEQDQMRLYATRVIMPDEELTICYNPDFETRTTRERAQKLRFHCGCKACLVGTPFQRVSDMRRTLIRGLAYLTRGEDIVEPRPVSARPILSDPELKRAAEELRTPLSTRLIATVLTGFLLEEEGLMDHLMVGRIMPTVKVTVAAFKTTSNVQIAVLVLAQKSWLGKVCMAFRMYGKEDDGDQEVSSSLRMARAAGLLL